MTHPWELTDTVTTLTDIMTVSRPRPGDVVVARVEIATQALSGFRLVQAPAAPLVLDASRESDEQLHALSDRLADAARDLGSSTMPEGARWSVPTGILVTVVCRTGRTVTTANEWQWASAWRYANHFTDAYNGDIFAMTPHGWISLEGRAGLRPALEDRDRPVLRIVS